MKDTPLYPKGIFVMDMFTAHENFMEAQKALLKNRHCFLYIHAWVLKIKTERYIRKVEKLKKVKIGLAHDVEEMNLRLTYRTDILKEKKDNS